MSLYQLATEEQRSERFSLNSLAGILLFACSVVLLWLWLGDHSQSTRVVVTVVLGLGCLWMLLSVNTYNLKTIGYRPEQSTSYIMGCAVLAVICGRITWVLWDAPGTWYVDVIVAAAALCLFALATVVLLLSRSVWLYQLIKGRDTSPHSSIL